MINRIFTLILLILLAFSLYGNVALYNGRIDVGQFREYVNKGADQVIEKYNDSATQSLINSYKKLLLEKYNIDVDNLSNQIKNYSKENAINYIKQKYPGISDGEIESILEIIQKAKPTTEKPKEF